MKPESKTCQYCSRQYWPHANCTQEQWDEQIYCRSICEANAEAIEPKEFGYKGKS